MKKLSALLLAAVLLLTCAGMLFASADEEPVMETITVDGVLDDTGWAESRWILCSIDEGTAGIQDTPEEKLDDAFTFELQMRTDDEYLYVATVVHLPLVPSTGVGSESTRGGLNWRIWFHADESYDRYTHFYDIWPDANGDTVTAAKYNTAKDDNKGAVIPNSSMTGVVKADGDKTIFEFAVKYSEFLKEGDDEIHFYVNPVNGAANPPGSYFVGVVYPAIPLDERTELDQTFMPWIQWWTEDEGVRSIEEMKLGEVPHEPSEEDYDAMIAAKAGEVDPTAEPKFTTYFTSAPGEDGSIDVTLTIKDLETDDKISGFIFPIYYDAERLTPNLSKNDDGSLAIFDDTVPGEKWENLSVLEDEKQEPYIYLQLVNAESEAQCCTDDTEILVHLNFVLNGGYDKGGIWLVNSQTTCSDWDLDDHLGAASYAILRAEGDQPTPIVDDPTDEPTDVPDEPTDNPTDEPTDEPTPGDMGIVLFTVLGVLAVAGAAVVIKVRK